MPVSLQELYQEFQRATEQLVQDMLQEQRVGSACVKRGSGTLVQDRAVVGSLFSQLSGWC